MSLIRRTTSQLHVWQTVAILAPSLLGLAAVLADGLGCRSCQWRKIRQHWLAQWCEVAKVAASCVHVARRIKSLDTALAVMRHITAESCEDLLERLSQEIAASGMPEKLHA